MDDVNSGGLIPVQAIFGEVLAFEGDFITGQLLEFGAHTRCELAFLLYFVECGDFVLDLGAHIGTFTVPLAKAVGSSGRVIAVEADSRNYAVLVENVARNDLRGQVRTLNAIVGNPAEAYELIRFRENTGMSQPVLSADSSVAAMNGLGLDEVAHDEPRIDVVKIVVQGMELDVLRASERMVRDRPILYVQAHDETLRQHAASSAELGAFLLRQNYRLFLNVGDRNAAHDRFTIREIASLEDCGPYVNVLAIPLEHKRLSRATAIEVFEP